MTKPVPALTADARSCRPAEPGRLNQIVDLSTTPTDAVISFPMIELDYAVSDEHATLLPDGEAKRKTLGTVSTIQHPDSLLTAQPPSVQSMPDSADRH
jgi:hypothetical protein